MSAPDAGLLTTLLTTALKAGIANEPRTLQSAAGILGPSDVGWCRNKAALTLSGVAPSDATNPWQLAVGTAVHRYYLDLLKQMFPSWLVEAGKVTATLSDGFQISGTPDIIVPEWNLLADLKTANGFDWVRRVGIGQNYLMQRHLYLLGALDAGHLNRDEPITLAEIYADRSGVEKDLLVVIEDVDWTLTDRVEGWLTDVRDAVARGVPASRDVPAPVCERTCHFFTACRGGDLPKDPDETITDPDLIEATQFYRDGMELEKHGRSIKEQAKKILEGVNGHTDKYSVRWTQIDESHVNAFTKASFWRLDVRELRRGGRA
jgi:hypothetical protein